MLDFLSFQGIGPAPVLGPVALAPRFNFITGDNGLGKSFVLDAAWWVLTRTWATNRSLKGHRHAPLPTIDYQLTGSDQGVGQWALQQGQWAAVGNVPNNRALVVYAHADGAFSVWDPVRNDARLPAFEFTGKQVWRGAEHTQQGRLCNGLIDDWVRWQRMHGNLAFAAIKRMLRTLSPSREELLVPGKPCHIGLLDETEYPTLRRPQGVVPLTEASSAIRRVVALAYMLVWAWQGHRRACRQAGVAASTELVFLVDEVECHLHANWQRRIVPALMAVVAALTQQRLAVQMVVATHSPLVLASMESDFDTERDGLFTLFLERSQVQLAKQPWAPQGDVVNWLVSKSFGLRQARSLGAERAIDAAEAWMSGDPQRLPCTLDDCAKIHAELLRTLPAGDHFWPRWIVATRKEPS